MITTPQHDHMLSSSLFNPLQLKNYTLPAHERPFSIIGTPSFGRRADVKGVRTHSWLSAPPGVSWAEGQLGSRQPNMSNKRADAARCSVCAPRPPVSAVVFPRPARSTCLAGGWSALEHQFPEAKSWWSCPSHSCHSSTRFNIFSNMTSSAIRSVKRAASFFDRASSTKVGIFWYVEIHSYSGPEQDA